MPAPLSISSMCRTCVVRAEWIDARIAVLPGPASLLTAGRPAVAAAALPDVSQLQICPAFQSFQFNGWVLEAARPPRTPARAPPIDATPATTATVPCADDAALFAMYAAGGGDDDSDGNDVESTSATLSSDDPTTSTAIRAAPSIADATQALSLAGRAHSEYAYFDPTALRGWSAIGSHWQLHTAVRTAALAAVGAKSADAGMATSTLAAAGTAKRRPVKETFFFHFDEPFDAAKHAKAFRPPARGPGATMLARATLGRQTQSATTLPNDAHLEMSDLLQLFLKPKWVVTAQLRRTAAPVDGDDAMTTAGGWYNYNNPSDRANFCPGDEHNANDRDNNNDDDDDDDHDGGAPMDDTLGALGRSLGLLGYAASALTVPRHAAQRSAAQRGVASLMHRCRSW